MILRELLRHARERLRPTVDSDGEVEAMVRMIIEEVKGYTPVDAAVHANDEMSDFVEEKVNAIVDRVVVGEPLQYVLGHARFMGNEYKVTPSVLIPRPETEQLVDSVVKLARDRSDLRVLDIGTGSGCIAIALARALRFAQVEAIDVSAAALEVARENAKALKAKVEFRIADALNLEPRPDYYDVIVSNPPYIAESERDLISPRVLEYEPSLALFVPDNDPLVFYRAISLFALKSLHDGGLLAFEINPLFVNELREMMTKMIEEGVDGEQRRWLSVDIVRDIHGRYRYCEAYVIVKR